MKIIGYTLLILFVLAILVLGLWHSYAFVNYPCEAFRTGFLSIQPAPGRCVQ